MKIKLQLTALILLMGALVFLGRYAYMTPNYLEGQPAPQFEGKLTNGEAFKLSSFRGKYTLIHFWGSWCGPCRMENPLLQDLWMAFKDKSFKDASGFEIISIAIEEDAQSAERAIKQDRLSWTTHITEVSESLKFFNSPISNIWGVNQVPSTFLLSPEGNIIGYNLSTHQISQLLNESAL